MKQSKPEWYTMLKSEPFTRKTFNLEKIKNIEHAVESGTRVRVFMGQRLVFFITCAVIITGLFLTYAEKLPIEDGGISSSPNLNAVVDDKGNVVYIDRKWLVSKELLELYQTYHKNKSEDLLIELNPLDIFKMYMLASQKGDYDTIYELIFKEAKFNALSREEYLTSISKYQESQNKIEDKWVKWKKTNYLHEKVEGETASIRMTTTPNSSDLLQADEYTIRLVKNNNGVWKLDWDSVLQLQNS